ncbi:SdrD B-like domain-containing protein [Ancylomarina sp.]|uniref:SdrD B-like domain-containing protein n=1 Tax=Ancylomarina sp. TaxID=1970196 RepID=UPI0035667A47
MKRIFFKYLFALSFLSFVFYSCDKNDLISELDEVSSPDLVQLKNGNVGETAYADAGTGEFTGYTDDLIYINTDGCPDYGVYKYTLYAGKTNNAGTVVISNDGDYLYVSYNTNGTADLGEAHVYVWTDQSEIPTKRPAPGHAPYKAEDINADNYTFMIPLSDFGTSEVCGSVFYVSTHAALVADGTLGDDADDGNSDSNDGETAYAGGLNTPDGFPKSKGAWWGYVTYTVDCYYDISGTVFEDADNSFDLESGESGFEGITVDLLDASGNVVASTLTAADGSYLFEHVAAGMDYSVSVASGPADYTATENASGFSIPALSSCLKEIDFGFYKADGDDDGDDDEFSETAYMFGNWSFCDVQSRWGWANYIEPGQTITETIYGGAGQCDISKGTAVGTSTIEYALDGTLTIDMAYFSGYTMNNIHINIDSDDPTTITPNMNSNGNFNSNPTSVSYPTNTYTETYSMSGPLYVIIHMEAVNE